MNRRSFLISNYDTFNPKNNMQQLYQDTNSSIFVEISPTYNFPSIIPLEVHGISVTLISQ